MTRQLALFSRQPLATDDINGATSLAATFDLFADHLRANGKSQHTVKAFLGDMRLLAQYAGGELPLSQLRNARLLDFLEWMEHERGPPCSRKTYARRVTTLKVYCKWLFDLNALADNPAQSIRQRSGPAPLSHVLTDAQVRDCIVAARQSAQAVGTTLGSPARQSAQTADTHSAKQPPTQNTLRPAAFCSPSLFMGEGAGGWGSASRQDARPEFLFRLLLQTGIKKAECGRLKLSDIDRSNPDNVVVFIRHKARNIYKERRIDLDANTLQLLDPYLQQYQPTDLLFTCTTRNLEYILTDIGARAQVPFKLSFEVMRWTMALREYLAGIEEDHIRQKLGLSRQSWYETGAKIRRLAAQSQSSTH